MKKRLDKQKLLCYTTIAMLLEGNQKHRGIAQLVEQRSPKPRVVGSRPSSPATYFFFDKKKKVSKKKMIRDCIKNESFM